jgi:hypothetical protein
MTEQTLLPPVTESILVDVPVPRAFTVFTEGMTAWCRRRAAR